MRAFDGNEYRKRVMVRLLDDFSLADPEAGDPFLVCDVEPDADEPAIRRRIDDVVAFWQKERNHPKYKKLAADLVARQDGYRDVLLDPGRRARAVQRVRGERARSDEASRDALEGFAQMLRQAHGGIPRSKVANLRAVARDVGVDEAGFTRWLAGQSVVDDGAGVAVAWDPPVRRQIRRALDELARDDARDGGRYRTLLTFLGVLPRSSGAELAQAHRLLAAANLSRPRDTVATLTEDLLTQVRTRLLVDGGVPGYLASLRADARDSVKDDLRRYTLLTGRLPAAELTALTARIVVLGWGIGSAEARRLVEDAAHELQLSVEVAGEVELVVCGSCERPQPAGRADACRYCGAALHVDCPSCGARIEAAAYACGVCAAPLAAWRAAEAAVVPARVALDAGRPVEAQRIARDAAAALGAHSAPAALRAVADAAAAQVGRAQELWPQLPTDAAAGRLWGAAVAARWLVRSAVDVPDPAPVDDVARTAAEWLADLEERTAAVLAEVAAAAVLPLSEAEPALERLCATYPDCPDAAGALARLPLPAPTDVTVELTGEVARVSWQAAVGAPPAARYLVERRVVRPVEHAQVTRVATATAGPLDDDAAPAGASVQYLVSTVDGNRTSPAVASPAVFVRRDVEALTAEPVGSAVELRWPTVGLGVAELVLQREVDPDSGVTGPVRRLHPTEPGRYLDDGVQAGVGYRYTLWLRYLDPEAGHDGTIVRTDGRSATALVPSPPRAVGALWASTDDEGRTTIAFASPPAGTVRIYAASGVAGPDGVPPAALPGFGTGTLAELDAAAAATARRPTATPATSGAATGVRLVGEGRRRVLDTAGRGALVYQAVTVSGDRVAAGARVAHLAVPRPAGLRVVADTGAEVTVTFDLPPGVTEAIVRWRRDRYPTSATEPVGDAPGAGGSKVTNTKLDIDGGFAVPAPTDGRGLYVAVFPAVRLGGGGAATPASTAATLLAREPSP